MRSGADAEIWYLYNSGFAVRAGERLLIFDDCMTRPLHGHKGLDGGVIVPEEIKGYDVTVFASHAHSDHYIAEILDWDDRLERVRFVLSSDIVPKKETKRLLKAYPNETYELDGLTVRTLRSTDEGVAFIVGDGGLRLYHAGDLNWWHWEGEPDSDNEDMARAYREQIGLIEGEAFDLAFVPLDPRLDGQYLWGLDYFMRHTRTKTVFPMHFGDRFDVQDRLAADRQAEAYRGSIRRITRRGERFEYRK